MTQCSPGMWKTQVWSLPDTGDVDLRRGEGDARSFQQSHPLGGGGQVLELFGAGDITYRCLSPVAALCMSRGCSHHICAQLPALALAALTHVCLLFCRATRPSLSPSSPLSRPWPVKPPLPPLSPSLAPWRCLGCCMCPGAPRG